MRHLIHDRSRKMIRCALAVVGAIMLILAPAVGSSVQITSAISVNGASISDFDIDQRVRMLRALGIPGNLRQVAEDALINDRLFLQEAERMGITLSGDMTRSGLEEYAGRRNQSAAAFVRFMNSRGIATDSINEFIRAGVAWRAVVNRRFAGRALEISEEEIDRALALRGSELREQILLSEIAMAYRPATRERVIGIANSIVNAVGSAAEFADAARSLSESESAGQGGAIGWVSVDGLPGHSRARLSRAPVGTAVGPVVTDKAIFVFFKRGAREIEVGGRSFQSDHATLRVYGDGRNDAVRRANSIMKRVDTCNDLLAESSIYPKGSYFRQTTGPEDTLNELKAPLELLDAGETVLLPPGGSSTASIVILMLCERKPVLDPEGRRSVLQALRSEKIEELAQNLITNLRASAIIIR